MADDPRATPPAFETTSVPLRHQRDPLAWCLFIPLVFASVAGVRLTIPSAPYFDEIHYLPAARELVSWWNGTGGVYRNPEHPLLGKELIAIGIALFGDNPLGWRIMPLAAGTLAVTAAMRAMWHASRDRFACVAFGVLLVTGFHLVVQARIAMLDVFMAAFLMVAAWQFAAAVREPETGRWRLAITGVAIGCALGSKWNAVPVAMAFGLAFFAARLAAGRRRLFTSRRGIPIPGISLIEAFGWLGIVPLTVYALTFAPGFALEGPYGPSPLAERGLTGFHLHMIDLQQQVTAHHSYQSTWRQWVLNARGIWYLTEAADGAQRGVLLIGNPLTMLLGLPALMWCAFDGLRRRDWAKIGAVAGYCAAIGLWVIAPKPVQFYYHYLVPSLFLLAALAFALTDLRRNGWRWPAYGVLAGSIVLFVVFYPVLTAAPLEGPESLLKWTWLAGWI